ASKDFVSTIGMPDERQEPGHRNEIAESHGTDAKTTTVPTTFGTRGNTARSQDDLTTGTSLYIKRNGRRHGTAKSTTGPIASQLNVHTTHKTNS
ncbi:hypothetical protein AVDCRST_MAG94-1311, partial [uncultured Leptolyngbya sp.]